MEFVKLVGPAGVFFIMFALGLNLTIRNFVKVFKSFENLIVGLICQIIILPVIGLILISLIRPSPSPTCNHDIRLNVDVISFPCV